MNARLRTETALASVFCLMIVGARATAVFGSEPSPSGSAAVVSPRAGPVPDARPREAPSAVPAGSLPLGTDRDSPPHLDDGGTRGVTSSPFQPPDPALDKAPQATFVINAGSGLDTGCTYRDGSPLIMNLPIRRYVGETNADGTLRNPSTLMSRHVIGQMAKLRLPAYDIDYDAAIEDYQPERDRISLNGHDLGFVTGTDETWKLNTFDVPIQWLKFPSAPGSGGAQPTEAMNEIRIDIDVANTDYLWCMAIDWAALSFNLMSPVLLVHGTDAQSDTWAPQVTNYLSSRQMVYSNDINLVANGTIAGNGALLAGRVQALGTQFGARNVHLMVHSKGGLDSRSFLGTFYDPQAMEVLSLYTLSTPHHGTILSTLTVAGRTLNDPTSDDQRLRVFFRQQGLVALIGQGPKDPALTEQTVANVARFNAGNSLPAGLRYYTFAADADLNGDTQISNAECVPVLPAAVNSLLNSGTLLYHLLCCVQGITVTRMTNLFGLNEWHVINPIPTATFQLNDLVVTEQSARYPGFTHLGTLDRNHSNMKDGIVTQTVLDRIQSDYPVN